MEAIFYKDGIEVFSTNIPSENAFLYGDKAMEINRCLAMTSLLYYRIEADRLVINEIEYDLTPDPNFEWFVFE